MWKYFQRVTAPISRPQWLNLRVQNLLVWKLKCVNCEAAFSCFESLDGRLFHLSFPDRYAEIGLLVDSVSPGLPARTRLPLENFTLWANFILYKKSVRGETPNQSWKWNQGSTWSSPMIAQWVMNVSLSVLSMARVQFSAVAKDFKGFFLGWSHSSNPEP